MPLDAPRCTCDALNHTREITRRAHISKRVLPADVEPTERARYLSLAPKSTFAANQHQWPDFPLGATAGARLGPR